MVRFLIFNGPKPLSTVETLGFKGLLRHAFITFRNVVWQLVFGDEKDEKRSTKI